MSLITGEDSESDEEINTDQVHHDSRDPTYRTGIVAGEDDEEEEEVDTGAQSSKLSDVSGSVDSLDVPAVVHKPHPQWEPPSLIHKKLGDANLSLRKNIVDQILKLYHATCRNLTTVNDNLSKAQGIIEKVNTNVKKSDHDLAQLKATLDDIFVSAQSLAPTLRMDIPIELATPTKGK